MSFQMIDTKLQAYRLIHDPTCLLSLLYSKYLDIEEDFGLLFANQILYNRPTHLNVCFKEQKTFQEKSEYLRRYYKKIESSSRIIKLNEYYKNYQSFFCKAVFSDFIIGNILKNYQDTKAENFYKNNYEDSSLNKEAKEKSQNLHSSQSLSSLDNITYNETIFDKKNKQIIENEDKNISITLTLDSLRKKEKDNLEEKNLISTSGLDESFIECLKNIVYYRDKMKEIKKNKKEEKKEDKKEKNNDLKNLCKKVNEKFKQKVNNKDKIILEKSNKENNTSKNLFSFLNIGNTINSPSNEDLKYISKRNKKSANNTNLFLSPQKNIQFYNTNITSRLSQFKKQIPINIKYLNRNKSYHYNNSKKNNRIIVSNFNPNSKNNTCYFLNNKGNEYNLNKEKSNTTKKLIKNTNDKTDVKNNKSTKQSNQKYNQFLFSNINNRNNINLKNNTFELINNGNKTKAPTQNILFNHYKKMVQSPRLNRNEMLNQRLGSKYCLFKGNLSHELSNDTNGQNNKRQLNSKIFLSSNSIDNNKIHISSLSPKSISSNLNINNETKRNVGINKINSNTCIQNNINIINKIKIHSKNNKSNSNYNINFNNLFFYGANTPTNYLDHINNNIINNQNKNSNFNKINTNFYLLNFNNFNNYSVDNDSRNQIKIKLSQNKKEVKTQNNANNKNIKEKKYISFKNSGLKLNKNKMPFFTIYKVGKIKDFSKRKSKEKVKNIKLEINNKKNF